MLPVEMCNTGRCRQKLKRIRRAAFHTSLYHSCHAGEGWSHIFLLLNSYLWSYVWPPNLPLLLSSLAPPASSTPPPPRSLWVLRSSRKNAVLWYNKWLREKRRQRRGRKVTQKSRIVYFFVVVVLWRTFCFAFPQELWSASENRLLCCCGRFSGAHQRKMKNTYGCIFSKLFGVSAVIF